MWLNGCTLEGGMWGVLIRDGGASVTAVDTTCARSVGLVAAANDATLTATRCVSCILMDMTLRCLGFGRMLPAHMFAPRNPLSRLVAGGCETAAGQAHRWDAGVGRSTGSGADLSSAHYNSQHPPPATYCTCISFLNHDTVVTWLCTLQVLLRCV